MGEGRDTTSPQSDGRVRCNHQVPHLSHLLPGRFLCSHLTLRLVPRDGRERLNEDQSFV